MRKVEPTKNLWFLTRYVESRVGATTWRSAPLDAERLKLHSTQSVERGALLLLAIVARPVGTIRLIWLTRCQTRAWYAAPLDAERLKLHSTQSVERVFASLTLAMLIGVLLLSPPVPAFSASSHQNNSICDTVEQIPTGECEALVAIYAATDGDNWINNEGWLQTNQPCEWFGLECDGTDHITRIFLEANQLRGVIPPELGDLSELTWLQLFDNQLEGSIPAELGKLDQVTWLRLEGNQLSGSIPSELGEMNALESLYLSGNPLTGSIPIELGNFPTLFKLYLSETQLAGPIPPELGNLSTLEFLILNETALSGPLPSTFTQLESLTFLQIQRSNLCEPQARDFQSWFTAIPDLYTDDIFCADRFVTTEREQDALSNSTMTATESATDTPQSSSTQPVLPTRIRPTEETMDTRDEATSATPIPSPVAKIATPISQNNSSQASSAQALLGALLLVLLLVAGMGYGWWIGQR